MERPAQRHQNSPSRPAGDAGVNRLLASRAHELFHVRAQESRPRGEPLSSSCNEGFSLHVGSKLEIYVHTLGSGHAATWHCGPPLRRKATATMSWYSRGHAGWEHLSDSTRKAYLLRITFHIPSCWGVLGRDGGARGKIWTTVIA